MAGPVTFTYRADGQRVEKETPSETVKFIHDGNKLLQETDGSGSVDHQYTFTTEAYGDLVSEYDGADTFTHHHDAIGSADALLDDSEAVAARYEHRAFGVEQSHTGASDTLFTFVGREGYYRDDELELYLAGARYYDPAAGRWLSEDPIGLEGGDANLYRYVGNNPVNAADPSGLEEVYVKKAVVEELLAEGKAHRVGGVGSGVIFSDVVGDQIVTYFLSYEVKQRRFFRLLLPPITRYRVYATRTRPLTDAELNPSAIADHLIRMRGDEYLRRFSELFVGLKKADDLQSLASAGEFVLHLTPGGAFADHFTQGNHGEAILSLAGDAAMFIGGPLAKVAASSRSLAAAGRAASVSRGLRVSSIALEGTVGTARLGQGIYAVGTGEEGASGYFGEAVLRLFGVSAQFRAAAKATPSVANKRGTGSTNLDPGKRLADNAANRGLAALDDVAIPSQTGTATRLSRRLSAEDMAQLQRKEGVEFAQVYLTGPGRNGGGGQTLLIRGTDRGVNIPVGPNVRIINHAHPWMLDGSVVPLRASVPDRQTMEALRRAGSPQRLSRIVTEEGHIINFTEFRARLRLQRNE